MIAIFADKMEIHEPLILSATEEELKALNVRRRQLVDMQVGERNRLKRVHNEQAIRSIKDILAFLQEQRDKIEKAMLELIIKDSVLKEKYDILTSVSGIGEVVAITLLCELPELGKLTDKQVGALSGLAPNNKESGMKSGRASIGGGRKCVRVAVYMAAPRAKKTQYYDCNFLQWTYCEG